MTLFETSETLHARVRRFAAGERTDSFEGLALDIARFQAEHSPGFSRLVASRGRSLDGVSAIPGVPVAAFRLARVAAHGPELDAARFETSGTTGSARGTHPFRTTATYEAVALRFGAQALRSTTGRSVVVCLAPAPDARNASSLAFMMRLFARAWDGRAFGDAANGRAANGGAFRTCAPICPKASCRSSTGPWSLIRRCVIRAPARCNRR